MRAFGGAGSKYGAAGTICLKSASVVGDGIVYADNNNFTTLSGAITALPAFAATTESLRNTQWIVRKKASVKMVADASVQSLVLENPSQLDLAGNTLVVDSLMIDGDNVPAGEYAASAPQLGTGFVGDTVGAGVLVVRGRATLLIVR